MIAQALIAALIMVESGGAIHATGDNGQAAGCLMIHKGVIADVNKHYKASYSWPADCFSREKSVKIAKLYLNLYCPKGASFERMSRTWNGGRHGYKKQATLNYWQKVRDAMMGNKNH